MPFEELKQKMTNEMLWHQLIGQEIGARMAIPEPELRKYYDAHPAEFVRKAQVFLSQILISTEGKTPEQAAAAETRPRMCGAGAQGREVHRTGCRFFRRQGNSQRGGSLPPREKGMSLPPIEEFAFKEKKARFPTRSRSHRAW